MTTAHTHIDDITFYRSEDGDDVVWRDRSGDAPGVFGPSYPGDLGTLRIEVGVDGMFTIVEHRGGVDRVVLEKVIGDLQYLVKRLDGVYLPDEPRGKCTKFGDWGRCYGDAGHSDDHSFPDTPDHVIVARARQDAGAVGT